MALIKMFSKSDIVDYSQPLGTNLNGLLSTVIITNKGTEVAEVYLEAVNGMSYIVDTIEPKKMGVYKLESLLTNEDLVFSTDKVDVFIHANVLEK